MSDLADFITALEVGLTNISTAAGNGDLSGVQQAAGVMQSAVETFKTEHEDEDDDDE